MEAFERVPSEVLNPNRPRPTFYQKLLVVLRALNTTILTLIVSIFIIIAKTLRPLLGRKFYRKVGDFVQQAWFDTVFAMLSDLRLHVRGQHCESLHIEDDDKRPRILICNHATDVDWFYLWAVAHTCAKPRAGHVKIMLKEAVRSIPLYGWLMDNLDFIWMKRDWEKDRTAIAERTRRLVADDEHLWLVIFPEGMTMNTKSLLKSQEFAKSQNRPRLEMTLLPRDKGLKAVLKEMEHLNPEILDVTMAFESFSGEIPTWEMGYERNNDHLIPNAKKLFAGMSGDVFIDVQVFDANEVLARPGGAQAWLDERWVRKDRFMRHFAQTGFFPIENGIKEEVQTKIPRGSYTRLGIIVLCDAFVGYCLCKLPSFAWQKVNDLMILRS